MSSSQPIGTADLDIDPDEVDRILGDGDSSSAAGTGLPSYRGIWGRLMSREGPPTEGGLEFTRAAALDYLKRGVGKFTRTGGTALEDFFWAGLNAFGALVGWGDGDDTVDLDDLDEL